MNASRSGKLFFEFFLKFFEPLEPPITRAVRFIFRPQITTNITDRIVLAADGADFVYSTTERIDDSRRVKRRNYRCRDGRASVMWSEVETSLNSDPCHVTTTSGSYRHEPELVGALYWSNESPVTANLGTPRRDQGTTKIELINRLNPRWMISALMFCEINKFERFESVTPVRSAFGPPLCRGFPRHSVLDYPSFGSK